MYKIILSSLFVICVASAFDLTVDTSGPVTAKIDGPSEVKEVSKPFRISVKIENTEDKPAEGTVRIGAIFNP